MFPPGHFLKLSQDEQVTRPDFERFDSGMQVTASRTPVYGGDAVAVGVPYEWETVFPHEDESFRGLKTGLKFGQVSRHAFRTSAVARATRQRGNPYGPPSNPFLAGAAAGGVSVRDNGLVGVRRRDDLTAVVDLTGMFTTTEAARRVERAAGAGGSLTLVTAGTLS
jgi:hypothetical protein